MKIITAALHGGPQKRKKSSTDISDVSSIQLVVLSFDFYIFGFNHHDCNSVYIISLSVCVCQLFFLLLLPGAFFGFKNQQTLSHIFHYWRPATALPRSHRNCLDLRVLYTMG